MRLTYVERARRLGFHIPATTPPPPPPPPDPLEPVEPTPPTLCTACTLQVLPHSNPGRTRELIEAGCIVIGSKDQLDVFCSWDHARWWMTHPSTRPGPNVPVVRPDGRPALTVIR